MKKLAQLLSAGLWVATVAFAQEPPAPSSKEPEKTEPSKKDGGVDAAKLRAWVKDLGSTDYATRRKATDALREAGDGAKPYLEEARNSGDAEVRWRARRLLRDLSEEGSAAGADPAPAQPAPRARGRGGRAMTPDFRDFQERLNEMMRQLEERGLGGSFRFDFPPLDPGGDPLSGFQGSMEMRWEEDGKKTSYRQSQDGSVEVEITDEDGRTKKYEARSRDELFKEHPELKERLRMHQGPLPRFWTRPLPLTPGTPMLPLPALPRADEAPAEGETLGVMVGTVPDVLRSQLRLDEGHGLLVADVVEDTLAERLGIQKHDVIVTVNDQAIASADDVARALKGAKDGKVRVEVVRKGERKTLEASK